MAKLSNKRSYVRTALSYLQKIGRLMKKHPYLSAAAIAALIAATFFTGGMILAPIALGPIAYIVAVIGYMTIEALFFAPLGVLSLIVLAVSEKWTDSLIGFAGFALTLGLQWGIAILLSSAVGVVVSVGVALTVIAAGVGVLLMAGFKKLKACCMPNAANSLAAGASTHAISNSLGFQPQAQPSQTAPTTTSTSNTTNKEPELQPQEAQQNVQQAAPTQPQPSQLELTSQDPLLAPLEPHSSQTQAATPPQLSLVDEAAQVGTRPSPT